MSREVCDRIVNNGMGEPTECGRELPCDYHDPAPEQDEAVRLLHQIVDWWNSRSPGFRKRTRADLFMQADAYLGQAALATPPPVPAPEQDEAVQHKNWCATFRYNLGLECNCKESGATAALTAGKRDSDQARETAPDTLATPPPVPAAPPAGLREALAELDAIDGIVDDTHPEGDGCPLCTSLSDLRNILERLARLSGPPPLIGAVPAAPPLDVERLRQAIAFGRTFWLGGGVRTPTDAEMAETIAAEYARLSPNQEDRP